MQKIAKSAAIAAVLAAVVNTIVFFVANALTGALIVNSPEEMTIAFFQPFVFTAMLGILGSLIVSFIAQRTASPKRKASRGSGAPAPARQKDIMLSLNR